METTDNVVIVKQKHSEKVGVPSEMIKLKLNGAEITDDSTLE